MAKRNKKKNADEETLKHYTSYDEQDIPAGIQKPAKDAGPASKPTFVKAKISVDKVLTGRKNAVINKPSEKKDKTPDR
jgi:hypothetical protein